MDREKKPILDNAFLIQLDNNSAIFAVSKVLLEDLHEIDVALQMVGEPLHKFWGYEFTDIMLSEDYMDHETDSDLIKQCVGERAYAYRYRKAKNLLNPGTKLGRLALLLNCFPTWSK